MKSYREVSRGGLEVAQAYVRFWHLPDIAPEPANVRLWPIADGQPFLRVSRW